MRRTLTATLLFLCCMVSSYAKQHKEALVNFGVKTGFSSTIYGVQQLQVQGHPINEYTAKSEISLFHTLFTRINIKRKHYLQTEFTYNISNYSITLPTQQWKENATPQDVSTIGTKIIGFEIPLLYGYHILKEGPYGMSFYGGPKAKMILTDMSIHNFDNFDYTEISETIYPINFSLMIGMGINIRNIFFDFSFEYGLHNISKGFTTIDIYGDTQTNDLIFDRKKNVLSFSIGFMF